MRRPGFLPLTLTIVAVAFAVASAPSRELPGVAAARGVLERTAHRKLPDVRLQLIPPDSSRDVYIVEASHGRLTIKGSNAVAITRGFYHYLRDACSTQVTWSTPGGSAGATAGSPGPLPMRLADFPATRVTSPFVHRQYFNVCTFGYTTAWWDWQRWERELDWMALHGINMPLAMAGQEAVWQKVWRAMGLTDAEIADYFTGPAFLPWHRMGNINHHEGPLPQSWIDGQLHLQRKILARMRELGMNPIVPAFGGFVPAPLRRLHPEARLFPVPPWAGFPAACQTFLLDPSSPLFVEIGKKFIEEYARQFGPSRYYLADSFNELQVPVSKEHRYDELAAFGKAVFRSIDAGDRKGTWVMQGWLFFNDAAFWDTASAAALMRDVPNDRMIILDLANEMFHGWKVHHGFYGKQWIYSVINNFGGNNALNGNLPFLASDPARTLADTGRGRLVGSGLAPEGVENNEVVYELATDMQWSARPADLRSWIRSYCTSRYGGSPPEAEEAWQLFLQTAYGRSYANIRHGFQERPSLNPRGNVENGPAFMRGLRLMLSCAPKLGSRPGYVNDVVEMTVQAAGGIADSLLRAACHAHEQGTPALRDTLAAQALDLLARIDALLGSRADLRLERWIASARSWGTTAAEKDYVEENARRQITIWGGPDLYDYAAKLWSGLMRDFYARRWRFFFDKLRALKEGERVTEVDQIAWEEQWIRSTSLSGQSSVADPLSFAQTLFASSLRLANFPPEPQILPARRTWPADSTLRVTITAPESVEVRYTVDGSEPGPASPLYAGPLPVTRETTVRARAFQKGLRPGFVSKATFVPVRPGVNGLRYTYVEGEWNSLPGFDTLRAAAEGIAYTLDLSDIPAREDFWGVRYQGRIEIPRTGEYRFSTLSDDGSRLWIDGVLLVDNDGIHAPRERSGHRPLSAGPHAIVLEMFENVGGQRLEVFVEGPGVPRQPLPPSWLFVK